MFPVQKSGPGPEKRLLELYKALPDAESKSLLDFAEFLAERAGPVEASEPQEPVDIPRPDEETVVAAMKRLRDTYLMLDHSKMLHEASGLMGEHMMQGRPAPEVIDELELMFVRYYKKHTDNDDT
ncbi:MAG: Crp/Fnr family transcriptional regulator [Pseudomonadota bacterium]